MFGLIKGADSVELKLTVPEADHRSTVVGARAWTRSMREIRQVFFFDTPDLALEQARASSCAPAGSSARATTRSSSCGRSSRTSCPRSSGNSPNLGVEVDAMPGGYVCSASLKASLRHDRRSEDRLGQAAAAQALHQGAAGVLRGARTRGHRARRSGRARPDLRAQAQVQARGLRPARSSPSSGSTRTARGSSSSRPSARRRTRSRSRSRAGRSCASSGVDLSGEQQTKTKTALEYFSKNLPAPASPA